MLSLKEKIVNQYMQGWLCLT